MKIIRAILIKEFTQIFRNKTMLPIIFVVPIVQLFILVFAATFEMKSISFSAFDADNSPASRQLVEKYRGSKFFNFKGYVNAHDQGINLMHIDEIDLLIDIPNNFEKDLLRENNSSIQFNINAINASSAALIQGYSYGIAQSFQKEINIKFLNHIKPPEKLNLIKVMPLFWYNPQLNYKIYMLPGLLVILVTLVGMFLSAMNLVREKELGTIEQINVTPIKKYHFIIGKLIPFWVIALFELGFGLTLGKLAFHIPTLGSIFMLFSFAAIYLILALGIGLFLSTVTYTQQQVMFLAWFIMIIFLLMSGLFTPAESMPEWAQKFNLINPFAYFIKVIRMILLKGSEFKHIWKDFLVVFLYGSAMLSLAVYKYRKVA